jgi:hypothetical protein
MSLRMAQRATAECHCSRLSISYYHLVLFHIRLHGTRYTVPSGAWKCNAKNTAGVFTDSYTYNQAKSRTPCSELSILLTKKHAVLHPYPLISQQSSTKRGCGLTQSMLLEATARTQGPAQALAPIRNEMSLPTSAQPQMTTYTFTSEGSYHHHTSIQLPHTCAYEQPFPLKK